MPAPLRHERQRAEDTLRAAGLHLKASWVDQACSGVASNLTCQELEQHLFSQALYADLHVAGEPCLPSTVSTLEKQVALEGRFVLQVDEVVNVGEPAESRMTDTPRRSLKLLLSDGHESLVALEKSLIPDLKVASPAGLKVVVDGVQLRRGIGFLHAGNCKVLGGCAFEREHARLDRLAQAERARSRKQLVQDAPENDSGEGIGSAPSQPQQQRQKQQQRQQQQQQPPSFRTSVPSARSSAPDSGPNGETSRVVVGAATHGGQTGAAALSFAFLADDGPQRARLDDDRVQQSQGGVVREDRAERGRQQRVGSAVVGSSFGAVGLANSSAQMSDEDIQRLEQEMMETDTGVGDAMGENDDYDPAEDVMRELELEECRGPSIAAAQNAPEQPLAWPAHRAASPTRIVPSGEEASAVVVEDSGKKQASLIEARASLVEEGHGSGDGGFVREPAARPATDGGAVKMQSSSGTGIARSMDEGFQYLADLSTEGPVGERVKVKAAAWGTTHFSFKEGFYDLTVVIEDGEGSLDVAIAGEIVEGILQCPARELMLLEKGLRKERLRNLSRELMKLEGVMTLERIEPRSVGAVGEASQAGMTEWCVTGWEDPCACAWALMDRVQNACTRR